MIFNFPERFKERVQTAFGFVAGNISYNLLKKGFNEVFGDKSDFDLKVYWWDDQDTFDEVVLFRDKNGVREEFVFGCSNLLKEIDKYYATPPMLGFKRSKKLIITTLGDVNDEEAIERYNTGPYEITWRGLVVDMQDHKFPIDRLKKLNEIFEVNGIWSVESEIMQALNIHSVIISDVSIDFVEGFEDTFSYEFSMRAVKPLEFQLINK